MARPVKNEIERIDKLLQGELTPKQRFALIIAQNALKWTGTIQKGNVPTPPSKQIMASEKRGITYLTPSHKSAIF